ncbi:MAG TPA: glycosyltransferase family 4 protein [Candidatus Paceibacterota bacterium]|nr:glycosyltransferase family 4 protein [Candidatus Paceibacterota bacterium]
MRLLVATPLYPPEPGGPATYAKILEDALPGQGIQTAILKFSEVRKFPKVLRHLAYFSLILRAGKDADAILALDPVSTGLPAVLAGRLLKKPVYVKIVGDYAWEQGCQRYGVRIPLDEFVRTRHVPTMVGVFRRVQTFVAKNAARVIVPSEYLRKIVTIWGIAPEHVTVIYNAMQHETLGALPGAAASMGRPRVVSVGRLVPWKGMPGVIEAMVKVREDVPDASLLIAGDGPEYDALERYAHVRLGEHGALLGRLSHADTLALIDDADVFVLNSTYEGLSHLLIEALALGKAVVATDVGGNPELIEDGKNGLLVPVGDREALQGALAHLLKTPEHRAILGRAALESAKRFSVEAMVSRTAAVLTDGS